MWKQSLNNELKDLFVYRRLKEEIDILRLYSYDNIFFRIIINIYLLLLLSESVRDG